jgi:hypothetical protein
MAQTRLSDANKAALAHGDPLSSEQLRQIQTILIDPTREKAEIQPSHLAAIQAKLVSDLIASLRTMDRTNTALSRRLVFLTWVLVVLTLVLVADAIKNLAH